jgi:hypothetical protein
VNAAACRPPRLDDSGRVVADVGTSVPLLAPVTRPLVDTAGRTVGEAMFAVAQAQAYVDITNSLVAGPVLVLAGTHHLAGTFSGPALLPSSGTVTFAGVHYHVASFPGVEFPSTPARIYVLDPLSASAPVSS